MSGLPALPRHTLPATLGLVSASLVASEVLFTRLLSVTAWYGHAFVVLSLAMVGLARGSLIAAGARAAGKPLRRWLARQMLAQSALVVLAAVVVLVTPLHVAANLTGFGALLVVAAAVTAPMVAGGAIVARIMSEGEVSLPRLYAIDLASAAAGAILPLALLGPLSAPAALVLLAGLLALGSAFVAAERERLVALLVCLAAMAVVLVSSRSRMGLELRFTKGRPRPPASMIGFEEWNPLSHVAMTAFSQGPFPLWGPSPRFRAPVAVAATALIDGEAGTPVHAFRNLPELGSLQFDVTNVAHSIRPDGLACVIGTGGGRDLESALLAGHDPVLGIEINPAIIEMLRAAAARSPLLSDPRVRIEVGDGRSVLARHPELHCRVLQASLVDTWAATGAGAFAHTESTLYTREAWGLFLRRVEPDGVLTFSRWYDPSNVSETSRLVSLAVAALLDRGVSEPAKHLALVASGAVATVLVSPAPFSAADLENLAAHTGRFEFQTLLAPDRPAANPLLARLVAARTVDDLGAAGEAEKLDTSPPTDDRPFFFQLLAARAWLHPLEAVAAANRSSGVISGNTTATLELLMTLLAVVLLGIVLLGPTVLATLRSDREALPSWRAALYFGALGAAFMLAEIALVQRMHVVLGHPTYALVFVLAGLLVATGLGSALSARNASPRVVSMLALALAALLVFLPFAVIGPLARSTADAPFAARVAWTLGVSAFVGLLAGTLFPSGLRFLSRASGTPLALAINGMTGVIGSVLAILLSVWAGIPASFVLAGLLYAVAAWAGPWGWSSRASHHAIDDEQNRS